MKYLMYLMMMGLLAQACKTSDVRTTYLLDSNEESEKLNSLLEKVESTYGGYENWKNIPAVRTKGFDRWPTFLWRTIASPWKNKQTDFLYTWSPNTDNSKIELLSGKMEGKQFGIQQWATYSIEDSTTTFDKNKDMWFHLPTMEYFFEFPFRVREAEIVKYAGQKLVNNQPYELIFFTWQSLEPNKMMDQYLVYVNPNNYHIDYIELTVRDQARWAYATVSFENFTTVDGFLFPKDYKFFFQNKLPGKTLGHEIKLSEIEVLQDYNAAELVPDSSVIMPKF